MFLKSFQIPQENTCRPTVGLSRPKANFIKKTPTQVFSCENCEIYKNNYFDEIANEIQSGFKLVFQVFYHYGIYLYSLKIDISS